MRYSSLKLATKRMLNQEEAGDYLGVPALLTKMESAGWIKPAVQRPKIKLYDANQLDLCCDRLTAGEFPS